MLPTSGGEKGKEALPSHYTQVIATLDMLLPY